MQITTDTSREPEINAGITDDGRGFITYFGDKPVYRSFEFNPAYDTFYGLRYADLNTIRQCNV